MTKMVENVQGQGQENVGGLLCTQRRVVNILTSQYISFSDNACILLFRTLDACTFGGILHSTIERRLSVKVVMGE